jgi:hypothetical protein
LPQLLVFGLQVLQFAMVSAAGGGGGSVFDLLGLGEGADDGFEPVDFLLLFSEQGFEMFLAMAEHLLDFLH